MFTIKGSKKQCDGTDLERDRGNETEERESLCKSACYRRQASCFFSRNPAKSLGWTDNCRNPGCPGQAYTPKKASLLLVIDHIGS